jgi:YfiH family protein
MARGAGGRERLRALVPSEPAWLRQVHGARVVDAAQSKREGGEPPQADAAFTREANVVCAVMVADCLPVLFAERHASAVAAAHAGWRGLCAGVLDATLDAMQAAPGDVLAWLGPAIGPSVYEVGAEVRDAFLAAGRAPETAFSPTRPGHWRLDLYAVARSQLLHRGLTEISGGGFCTYTDAERFYSFRRGGEAGRMAAAVWLT